MSYKPNLPGVFVVPNAVADEHLKLARELELKVLLWLLRYDGSQGLAALAGWLGKPEGDLVNAVQFWIDRGVIRIEDAGCRREEASVLSAPMPLTPESSPLPPDLPPVRPTQAQIITRTGEDPGLRGLFGEADKILERTIGHEGQCTLLMLHDCHGLPNDVIYMLLRYCKQIGKTNNAYIEAVGRDWGRREIDTIEKAAAQMEALQSSLALWNELRRRTGIHAPRPTAAQQEALRRWNSELGFGIEMIHAAYEEMAERTGKLSFSYMNKVLEGWHAAGVKTPEEAAAAKAQFQQKRQAPAAKKNRRTASAPTGYSPSFDLEAFEQSTLQVPVFTNEK